MSRRILLLLTFQFEIILYPKIIFKVYFYKFKRKNFILCWALKCCSDWAQIKPYFSQPLDLEMDGCCILDFQ